MVERVVLLVTHVGEGGIVSDTRREGGIVVFPSYYKLRGAILFSNLIMCRFLFLKVKLTYVATEIQLSYPEWIATCIQLNNLEKYLLLLNRNLTKCKSHFELRKENRPL